MNAETKIVDIGRLSEIVGNLRSQGKKIVATNGGFDLLHVGHLEVLEKSKALGDVLIIGINSDASVRLSKPDRPILPEGERARLVAALECVDYVTLFEEKDPIRFLEFVRPDIYTKGGDYTLEQNLQADFVRNNVGEIKIIPGRIQSTTGIIDHIMRLYSSKNSQK